MIVQPAMPATLEHANPTTLFAASLAKAKGDRDIGYEHEEKKAVPPDQLHVARFAAGQLRAVSR